MRLTALALFVTLAGSAGAQAPVSGPPATSPTPEQAAAQPTAFYVPLFGVTAGISIPLGKLSDDHGAGYGLGGLVEYAVAGQPYSLRGEAFYQRFPLKSGHAGDDTNLFQIGATVMYKLQQSPTQTFITGGIAIYNATHEGTRPGVNFGTGVEIPLTGFSAMAEARVHLMLADARPVIAIPLTVSVKF